MTSLADQLSDSLLYNAGSIKNMNETSTISQFHFTCQGLKLIRTILYGPEVLYKKTYQQHQGESDN